MEVNRSPPNERSLIGRTRRRQTFLFQLRQDEVIDR